MTRKLIAVLLAAGAVLAARGNEWTDPETGYMWRYQVNGEGIDICGYYTSSGGCAAVSPKPSGDIVIPETFDGKQVLSLGEYAFYQCEGLTKVDIPNSVTNIGYVAFRDCALLRNVNIPNGVVAIGREGFARCYRLMDVRIPSSVRTIKDSAFIQCMGLTNLDFSTGIDRIEGQAFQGCERLERLVLPDGLTTIGQSAFSRCYGLKHIEIPASVVYFNESAFYNCTNVTDAVVPGWQCGIAFSTVTNLVISDGTSKIRAEAFSGCNRLSRVIIPGSVTNIGDRAFSLCNRLTDIMFDGDAPEMGQGVFNGVTSNCRVYVRPNSTGWNVDIPGTWNGMAIDYLPEIADQYVVIDLSGGANATSYPVSYLSNVPSGGWTDEYKTTKLVLRKIDAGKSDFVRQHPMERAIVILYTMFPTMTYAVRCKARVGRYPPRWTVIRSLVRYGLVQGLTLICPLRRNGNMRAVQVR